MRLFPAPVGSSTAQSRADIAFVTLLVGGGIALPETRVGWAALLISFGIGAAVAFLFIEPATARAAFRSDR